MPRTYRKPPVIEAVCEFRFQPSQPWDWTIPGLVYERIRDQFPKKRQQNLVEMAVAPSELQLRQPAGMAGRMHFLRQDESALIQLGPDLLAVNHVRPYPSWPTFKVLILEQLATYRAVAVPSGISRIGLRYIDRIVLPHERVDLEQYFVALPRLPQSIPQEFTSFLVTAEIPFSEPAGTLRFTLGTSPDQKDQELAFILDLDLFSTDASAPGLDEVSSWLDLAHREVEQAFEASFTEKTHHEIFEAVAS